MRHYGLSTPSQNAMVVFLVLQIMICSGCISVGSNSKVLSQGEARAKGEVDRETLVRMADSDPDIYARVAAIRALGDPLLTNKHVVDIAHVKSLWARVDTFGRPCSLKNLYAELWNPPPYNSQVAMLNTEGESVSFKNSTNNGVQRTSVMIGPSTRFDWGMRTVEDKNIGSLGWRLSEFIVYRLADTGTVEKTLICKASEDADGNMFVVKSDITVNITVYNGVVPIKEKYGALLPDLETLIANPSPEFLSLKYYRAAGRDGLSPIPSVEVTHSDILLIDGQMATRCVEVDGKWYWFEEPLSVTGTMPEARKVAVYSFRDQKELCRLAVESPYREVRFEAHNLLNEQVYLMKAAMEVPDVYLRKYYVSKITDIGFLEKLTTMDKDAEVRDSAVEKLKELREKATGTTSDKTQ